MSSRPSVSQRRDLTTTISAYVPILRRSFESDLIQKNQQYRLLTDAAKTGTLNTAPAQTPSTPHRDTAAVGKPIRSFFPDRGAAAVSAALSAAASGYGSPEDPGPIPAAAAGTEKSKGPHRRLAYV